MATVFRLYLPSEVGVACPAIMLVPVGLRQPEVEGLPVRRHAALHCV